MSAARRLPVVLDTAAAMTEAELQHNVEQAARACGWLVYHTRFAFGSEPGFPDVVLLQGERLLFAELKRTTGKLTPAQEFWIWSLQTVPGIEVFVWRPEHWLDNSILRILTRKDERHADAATVGRALLADTADGAGSPHTTGRRRVDTSHSSYARAGNRRPL